MKRLLVALLLAGCGPVEIGTGSADVIHGSDDRRDWFEVEDARLREIAARSVVALVKSAHLDAQSPADVRIVAPTLAEAEGVCETERFAADPTAAECSGTLIGDDLVLTAGHCVRNGCEGLAFVFGYYRSAPGELHRLTSDDVFSCSEVVTSVDGPTTDGELDHAIVRLDRPATPRFLPVDVRSVATPLAADQALVAITFGAGLPAKIDTGVRVVDPRGEELDFFLADSDTFVHSSGGALFDGAAGQLVGIVTRGPGDWVASENGCFVARSCDGGCPGAFPYEEAQYPHHALSE